MRPPRPERTSFSLSSEMSPPSPGLTNTCGGGIEPPFALGIFEFFVVCVYALFVSPRKYLSLPDDRAALDLLLFSQQPPQTED